MLRLVCTVRSLVVTPETTDRKTGEYRPAKTSVQVEITKENGQIEIQRIKIDPLTREAWEAAGNKLVELPVNVWAQGGRWGFWLDPGTVPTHTKAAVAAVK